MKIAYKHIAKYIKTNPKIDELSEKLFQLGHEHEIYDEIFDIEFTPNRGDCLSIDGLLRDLSAFYDVEVNRDIYIDKIKAFDFSFTNDSENSCSNISFLKLEIDNVPTSYIGSFKSYFSDLDIKKNNFFTDISNYISYETGQPTHCYDYSKIFEPITLGILKEECDFVTLLNKEINLQKGDLVFKDKNDEVINLAGVIGGKNTACDNKTKSVLLECAHFNPETIIGKTVKYDINSDAAHKFERNTDASCHDYVLRRFISIVASHSVIRNIELFTNTTAKNQKIKVPYSTSKINGILGINLDEEECISYLEKLGFKVNKKTIEIPSHRNDIYSINDISEEIARVIGYNNIEIQDFKIPINYKAKKTFVEDRIRKYLINEGFYEVINNPFVKETTKHSVIVDNPLDSNRKYLRIDLKTSLLENLLYNERRQKDTIKLFEISDLYSTKSRRGKKVVGLIASGKVDKNYLDFSKKINENYFINILQNINLSSYNIQDIKRESLDSKSKNPIIYCEIEIDQLNEIDQSYDEITINDINDKHYTPISEFPSSSRDLSFSIKDFSKSKILEEFLLNFKDELLKDTFVFDYYKNNKLKEIKIGFRFVFQSKDSTITETQVNKIMNDIINETKKINGVSIPGLE